MVEGAGVVVGVAGTVSTDTLGAGPLLPDPPLLDPSLLDPSTDVGVVSPPSVSSCLIDNQ